MLEFVFSCHFTIHCDGKVPKNCLAMERQGFRIIVLTVIVGIGIKWPKIIERGLLLLLRCLVAPQLCVQKHY